MESKRLLLIVNPKSGREKMRGQLLRVTEILTRGGYEVTVYPTKEKGDGTVRAAQIKQNEYDRVVVWEEMARLTRL